ncbi:similar to Saccharomyces cerevisiae YBR245C ISW1 Member of the imitation-switch (ISWI) class of ATP-dependent chromatin remodeling complexes [Maudiozyma saulgeensis]|uniref:Similar to Saccharomyces cerevisiae YBR245C ISW1 Member of the imitation-switch (ISWI) class of ATP-dependent chromatin remodeling complexes n=1 Tax=Maudiozyma saulgeensis TaxID=1789683 RepID=A0A1X7QZY1_9SACH|nr:similar to Saccharomyces cerevisiae YBR245C ISW1 Member of the imitation-switch (ISWI) class of ATP-dependent chromatin remodeling complexes [Kazachstania saulgeensis]
MTEPTVDYSERLKPYSDNVSPSSIEERKLNYLVNNLNESQKKELKQKDLNNTEKRLKELLSISPLFRHFIENKANEDATFKSILDDLDKKNDAVTTQRKRKTEREEDAELLKEEEDEENDEDNIEFEFRDSPGYINGQLRPYQIQGLNWLISLHNNGLSGILADEMGLGKTLQTISFLGYLRYIKNISGPFLVIAPKSTLNNWLREINKWTPEVNALILQGDKEERANLIKNKIMQCDFDIVIASYEIIIREKATFRKFGWEYLVIDEAHRIKNEESMLSQVLREFRSRNRLLITGTPLQNNLHELWALLNFLLPDIFSSSQDFDSWFSSESTNDDNQDQIVKQLHTVLKPFLLRRIKNDVETSLLPKQELNVYVGMSSMQKKWYRQILEKDIDAVNGTNATESKTRLLNIVMQLRKCCNHPYLFDGAEPGPPYTTDEHLVYNSAKLKVLDRLLKKLKSQGSRVLIFSQMSRLLDILEDYCFFRDYKYCRIDGSTDHEDRIKAIDDYNAPDSDKFLFLLTTRAGGLGINLTSADTVVLFDSDWNPQADLQAMDRAHRIGQKKQVRVFRFVTNNSVEEKIIERATQKLRLDKLVIQQNRTVSSKKKENKNDSKDALLSMIQHGAADVFTSNSNTPSVSGTPEPNLTSNGTATAGNVDPDPEVDLDAILSLSENKTQSLNKKYDSLGLDDLQKVNQESAYEWDGQNFKKQNVEKQVIDPLWLITNTSRKRERKENYSVDNYYKDILYTKKAPTPLQPRMPKPHVFSSHQMQRQELKNLYERERMYIAKKTKYVPTLDDVKATYGEDLPIEEQKLKLKELKKTIADAEPLTEEEETQKIEWEKEGFSNWNKIDFRKFISLSGKYGRNSIQAIAMEMEGNKTLEEVRAYAKAFWANYKTIEGYEKLIKNIEEDEAKLRHLKYQEKLLTRKLAECTHPFFDFKLKYPPSTNNKRVFSEEEDRFLLITLAKYGLQRNDIYEVIRDEIRDCPMFEFNFFFSSRTPLEISRRIYTLLQCLEKEANQPSKDEKNVDGKKKNDKVSKTKVSDTKEISSAESKEVKAENIKNDVNEKKRSRENSVDITVKDESAKDESDLKKPKIET